MELGSIEGKESISQPSELLVLHLRLSSPFLFSLECTVMYWWLWLWLWYFTCFGFVQNLWSARILLRRRVNWLGRDGRRCSDVPTRVPGRGTTCDVCSVCNVRYGDVRRVTCVACGACVSPVRTTEKSDSCEPESYPNKSERLTRCVILPKG